MCKWKKRHICSLCGEEAGQEEESLGGIKVWQKRAANCMDSISEGVSLICEESFSYLHSASGWRILLLGVVLFRCLFLVSPTHRQACWKVLTGCTHIHTLTWEFMTPSLPVTLGLPESKVPDMALAQKPQQWWDQSPLVSYQSVWQVVTYVMASEFTQVDPEFAPTIWCGLEWKGWLALASFSWLKRRSQRSQWPQQAVSDHTE